jgi:hypothetical protein
MKQIISKLLLIKFLIIILLFLQAGWAYFWDTAFLTSLTGQIELPGNLSTYSNSCVAALPISYIIAAKACARASLTFLYCKDQELPKTNNKLPLLVHSCLYWYI